MRVGRPPCLRRLVGALVLGSAFAVTPASACLIEYSLTAEAVPLTIDAVLTADTSLPIAEQIVAFEVVMPLFADFDQKANQLLAILLEEIRAETEAELQIVRNLTIATSSPTGTTADQYSLIFSLPDGSDLALPLECAGTCIGAAVSLWNFEGQIPEPSTSLLILGAMAASWPTTRHSRRVAATITGAPRRIRPKWRPGSERATARSLSSRLR
jgi:hypothetical protein